MRNEGNAYQRLRQRGWQPRGLCRSSNAQKGMQAQQGTCTIKAALDPAPRAPAYPLMAGSANEKPRGWVGEVLLTP
jgi:hypothetical protein